jgi:hypothetical protein
MTKQQLSVICLLVIGNISYFVFIWFKINIIPIFAKASFTTIEATIYCPDPLNIQAGSRSDSPASPNSASAAGVVTCDSAFDTAGSCGVGFYFHQIFILIIQKINLI